MKIRNPWLIRGVALTGSWVLRSWMRTLRYDYRPLGPDVDPTRDDMEGHYIYAIWHENVLQPVYRYCGRGIYVLISRHADGQLLAELCRWMGVVVVRGSTNRGGVEAMRRLIRHGRKGSLAITPDGPRGPRRRVQPGLIYLASQTGLPIVPTGFGYQHPWRLRSWDRFAVPRPWSRGTCVTGSPIDVPVDATREDLDRYREVVEHALLHVTEVAEQWAESGQWSAGKGLEAATMNS
jgi:lysophospholipid acyltransferase (LPLAT)-like uncharacterized protein